MSQNAQQLQGIGVEDAPSGAPLSESYPALVESFNRKLLAENKSSARSRPVVRRCDRSRSSSRTAECH